MSDWTRAHSDFCLKPQNMLRLYGMGAFPMSEHKRSEIVEWFCPETRTVILLNDYNIPRSLKKFMRNWDCDVRFDSDILRVIKSCRNREESWISPNLIEGYKRLIELKYIHSLEIYRAGGLVGGLYGIAIGGVFFGESMFSIISQASKVAFAHLIIHLAEQGFSMIDVQYETPHLKMFGTKQLSLGEFRELCSAAYLLNSTY